MATHDKTHSKLYGFLIIFGTVKSHVTKIIKGLRGNNIFKVRYINSRIGII